MSEKLNYELRKYDLGFGVKKELLDKIFDCFDKCEQDSTFQNPHIYMCFKEVEGYHPFVVINMNKEKNEIAGFMFGYEQRLTKFLDWEYRRAVIEDNPIVKDYDSQILKSLLEFYLLNRGSNVAYTEIRNNHETEKNIYESCGFIYEDHLNYEIDLERPLETIWTLLKQNVRNYVRKAKKNNVEITEIDNLEDLKEGYYLLKSNYKKIGVPLPPYSLFKEFYLSLLPLKKMKFYIAVYEDKIIGLSIRLISKNKMTAWYTAINYEYKKLGVQDALNWHSISDAHSMGLLIYDFGGAGKPNENYGPRDYKSKFNGTLTNYGRYYYIHKPIIMKLARLGYRLIKRVRNHFNIYKPKHSSSKH